MFSDLHKPFLSSFLKIIFSYLMCMDVHLGTTCVHLGTTCVPGAHGDQKIVSYPLELELQMIASHHVGAGN